MKNEKDAITCKSCQEFFNGECLGRKDVCEFYKFKPPMTRQKYEEWPQFNEVNPYKK